VTRCWQQWRRTYEHPQQYALDALLERQQQYRRLLVYDTVQRRTDMLIEVAVRNRLYRYINWELRTA